MQLFYDEFCLEIAHMAIFFFFKKKKVVLVYLVINSFRFGGE